MLRYVFWTNADPVPYPVSYACGLNTAKSRTDYFDWGAPWAAPAYVRLLGRLGHAVLWAAFVLVAVVTQYTRKVTDRDRCERTPATDVWRAVAPTTVPREEYRQGHSLDDHGS